MKLLVQALLQVYPRSPKLSRLMNSTFKFLDRGSGSKKTFVDFDFARLHSASTPDDILTREQFLTPESTEVSLNLDEHMFDVCLQS